MNDNEAFAGKSLSDLLKDIHDNAVRKRAGIDDVIKQLTALIHQPNDAIVLAPLIREFMDVSVKNDEQIIKVATIVQRMASAKAYSGAEDGGILSDADKEQLLLSLKQDVDEVTAGITEATDKLESIRG